MNRVLTCTALCLLWAMRGDAITLYVDVAVGDDLFSGQCALPDGGGCGPKRTLGAALLISANGDEIVVADGTYTGAGNHSLNFGSRTVVIRSANGPGACTFDCGGAARFISLVSAPVTIRGLTIRGCTLSAVDAFNCGALRIEDSVFVANSNNPGDSTVGQAVKIVGGTPRVERTRFERNDTAVTGALFVAEAATLVMTDCSFEENSYSSQGTLVRLRDTLMPALIENCSFRGNRWQNSGGLLALINADVDFENVRIVDNQSNGSAFMQSAGGCELELRNCFLGGNVVAANRLLRAIDSTSITRVENCTFLGNEATAILEVANAAPVRIVNTVVWQNLATTGNVVEPGASLVVRNSQVEGGAASFGAAPGTLNYDASNSDLDPQLAFPGDPHLRSGSPCIDSGSATEPVELTPFDLDGRPRVIDGDGLPPAVVDRGATEHDPANPALAVESRIVELTGYAGGPPVNAMLRLRNAGGGTLNWTTMAGCAWLTATTDGALSGGALGEVSLTADVSALSAGTYSCALTISGNGLPADAVVHVRLRVATVRQVPGQFATIQAALTAAQPGDLVLLAPGTYRGVGNRDLSFAGKALELRGAGPEAATIDCELQTRAIRFESAEGRASVVSGIRFINGLGSPGGAIFCNQSSPTIRDCWFEQNQSIGRGGAIYADNGSRPLIQYCEFVDNDASGDGGALALRAASSAALLGCRFERNAGVLGGAVYCVQSSPEFSGCSFQENVASGSGGAAYIETASAARFINSVFDRNVAADDGGAVYSRAGSDMTWLHVTSTGNSAERGGSIYAVDMQGQVLNSVLWQNVATQNVGPEIALALGTSGSPCGPSVDYSNVAGGLAQVSVVGCALNWGSNNVNANPLFALSTDYHLLPDSPSRDAGTDQLPFSLPVSDFDGASRVADGGAGLTPDQGAFEASAASATLAVSDRFVEVRVAEGSNSDSAVIQIRNAGAQGLAWTAASDCGWATASPAVGVLAVGNDAETLTIQVMGGSLPIGTHDCTITLSGAGTNLPETIRVRAIVFDSLQVPGEFSTIQAAINAASANAVVVVADGLYQGAGNRNLDLLSKRIALRSASGPANCVIDCQGAARGFTLQGLETPDTLIEGFTIRNGNASQGGGIVVFANSRPTIRNCVIENCTSSNEGGGLALFWRATVEACTIRQCTASQGGGAFLPAVDPIVRDCVFEGNSSTRGGGALITGSNARPRLLGNVFSDNTAAFGGGGIHITLDAKPIIRGCVFSMNDAPVGGGIQVEDADPQIVFCSFDGNTATDGGAMYAFRMQVGSAFIGNIVSGNSATRDGGGIVMLTSTVASVANCQIDNNTAVNGGGALLGGGVYTNMTVANNTASSGGGLLFRCANAQLNNSIVYLNQAASGPSLAQECGGSPCSLTVNASNIQGGEAAVARPPACVLTWGSDNQDQDPLFQNQAPQLVLSGTSPSVDAGRNDLLPADVADLDEDLNTTEAIPLDGLAESRVNLARVDQGAFEYIIVSLSGDMNCDGFVSVSDISGFVLALTDAAGYAVQYPACDVMHADTNNDGQVSVGDIASFVQLLIGE